MTYLDEDRIRTLLRMEDLIPVMEKALIDFSAGRVSQPVRSVLPVQEAGGFLAIMPAIAGDVMGTKLVTFYPGNANRNLPTHHATIQLFSTATGEPLAVMDGRLITEMRTAAVSAVATRLLSKTESSVLAILGSGVQARAHVSALRVVRPLTEIRVWSRTPAHARRFADEVGARVRSAEDAVRGADVVVTVTSALEPVLHGRWLKEGVLVNAVGAVGPARRELDDDAMNGEVIVESRAAALQESGDVILSHAQVHAELGELLAGTKPLPRGGRTIFKSLGIAAEDIAAARHVHDAARTA